MTELVSNDMFNESTNLSGLASILYSNGDKEDLDALEASIMGANVVDEDIIEKFEKSVKHYGDKNSFNLFNAPPSPNVSTSVGNVGMGNINLQGSSSDSDDSLSDDDDNEFFSTQQNPIIDNSINEERKKYENVNNVMNEIRQDGFDQKAITERVHYDLQKHLEEDNKCRKIDEISELRTILTDEGVDLKSIPEVNMGSTDDEINIVHRVLRIKNDRSRYVSLSDELFLMFGFTLEHIFDGKTSYMGFKPDYTGYTREVLQNRLHRIRYDSSQIISEFVEGYGMGRKSKIAFELIPSLFTYGRKSKTSNYNTNINDQVKEDFN